MNQQQHHISNAPDEFTCPLTLELMINPVVNRQGKCYERAALVKWLAQPNATCPLTRQPIQLSEFIPNAKLQKRIMQWRINQGEDVDEITEESTSTCSLDADFASMALYVRSPSLLTGMMLEQQQQQPDHNNAVHRRHTTRRRNPLLRFLLRGNNNQAE
jgi:U-box domain